MTEAGPGPVGPVAIVVKGYPRLSETFIAQEILALQRAGLALEIWALRKPTDKAVHPLNRAIDAPVRYLPEYLYQAPLRVLKGAWAALGQPGFGRLMGTFWRDLLRDPTPNRGRRLGQAFVMARELSPAIRHIHVHYLHTPASVVRYAAMLTGRSFSVSAHAKDIWTTPAWEKAEKIADAAFGVTCTQAGLATLRDVASPGDRGKLSLVYHGLDLSRFPDPPARPARDGSDPADPVVILSVGRAVAKKGYADLLPALARLPAGLHWRFVHIGSGELRDALKRQAAGLGIADRIDWRGGQAQDAVIAAMREADLFVLPCREGDKGDRDGLPNVIMEAATQALPILSTRFAGVPEFVTEGRDGLLVEPGDSDALAGGVERLARDPALRRRLGAAALERVRTGFSFEAGVEAVRAGLLRALGLPAERRQPDREAAE
ncbi:MAG: glycosyltransferase family 4 protein [Alsobacter sp.]